MRLKIRNCVTDPEKKALRQKGQGVMRPMVMGDVLAPGAIRMVAATDMTRSDVDTLDFLVKNHSCTALVVGQGFLSDCGPIYDFLGFSEEEEEEEVAEPVVEEVSVAVEEPVIEDVLEEEEEEPSVDVEEVEVPSEEVQEGPTYTESELKNMKNADLRDIATLLVEDAQVGGLSKKKLVAFIMENQNA